MDNITYIIFGFIFLLLAFFLVFLMLPKKKSKSDMSHNKKDKMTREQKLMKIDDLRRELKMKPGNHTSRERLVELLMDLEMYLPAIKECLVLIDASAANPAISELDYTIRVAQAYFALKNYNEAKKYFIVAKKKDDIDFRINFGLANIEYENLNLERANMYLREALNANPNNAKALKLKGFVSYKMKLYRDALKAFLKFVEVSDSGDNEIYFYLGSSYFYLKRYSDARKILNKINDSRFENDILYFNASMYYKEEAYIKAIETYEKYISKGNISKDKVVDACYNLAQSYIKTYNTAKALHTLEKAAKINPGYKDIQKLIEKYSQLSSNSILEKYLIGSYNQFESICKIFVKYYIKHRSTQKGNLKIEEIKKTPKGELEIHTEISSNKFVTLYVFVFFRTTNVVGELEIRGIYNKLREEKIDKGICVTPGNFSDSVHNFIESRMLEIVEKDDFSNILKTIGKSLST